MPVGEYIDVSTNTFRNPLQLAITQVSCVEKLTIILTVHFPFQNPTTNSLFVCM